MASTFLVLTNKLLRRLNEVELTSSDFASAKNTQAAAKDCIITAVSEINTSEYQWPWINTTATQAVTLGDSTYSFTDTSVTPDWNTFTLTQSATSQPITLKYLTSEEYYKYYRQIDLEAIDTVTGAGSGYPKFIYPIPGGFGISPVPDANYTLTYDCTAIPPELTDYDDVCSIPTAWDFVILNMALKHYYMYKDNVEAAGFWVNESNKSYNKMVSSLVNRQDYVWSNMVNFGGQKWSIDYTKV